MSQRSSSKGIRGFGSTSRDQQRTVTKSPSDNQHIERLKRAIEFHELGRYQEAELAYRSLLDEGYVSEVGVANLALLLSSVERHGEAIKLVKPYVRGVLKHSKPCWINLCDSYLQSELYSLALESADEARKYCGDDVRIDIVQANTYIRQSRLAEARQYCRDLLTRYPRDTNLLRTAAAAEADDHNYSEALELLRQSLVINKGHVDSILLAGEIYAKQGEWDAALGFYREAFRISPNNAFALRGLIRSYLVLGYGEEAVDLADSLPDKAILGEIGTSDVIESANRVHNWGLVSDLLNKVPLDKIGLDVDVKNPWGLFGMDDSAERSYRRAIRFAEEEASKQADGRYGPYIDRANRFIASGEAIRIGYFSADYKLHPVSQLIRPVFEMHSRSEFEIVAISNLSKEYTDGITDNIRRSCDRFLDVFDMDLKCKLETLRDLELDILVDLSGHTAGSCYELFRHRVAPIQINYLGYPGTLGGHAHDFILADSYVIPEHLERYYTERVLRLPDCMMPYEHLSVFSEKALSRDLLGLPEDSFVLCNFSAPYKLTESIFRAWLSIMKNCSNTILWLSSRNESANKRLLSYASNFGINDERICFAERAESIGGHINRMAAADLFLDTYPYGAHTTCLDAARAGVPIVTLSGESFQSRVAGSINKSLGMSELNTNSIDQYIEVGSWIAGDRDLSKLLRNKVRKGRLDSSCFNPKVFVSQLEEVFRQSLIL